MASFNPNEINGPGDDAGSSGTVVFRPNTSPVETVVMRGGNLEPVRQTAAAVAEEAFRNDAPPSNTRKAMKNFNAHRIPDRLQPLPILVKRRPPHGRIPEELTGVKIYNTPPFRLKVHASASGKHQFVEANISPFNGEIYPVREPVLRPGQENLRTLPGLSPAVLPIERESGQAREEGVSGTVLVRLSPGEDRENIPPLANVLHANASGTVLFHVDPVDNRESDSEEDSADAPNTGLERPEAVAEGDKEPEDANPVQQPEEPAPVIGPAIPAPPSAPEERENPLQAIPAIEPVAAPVAPAPEPAGPLSPNAALAEDSAPALNQYTARTASNPDTVTAQNNHTPATPIHANPQPIAPPRPAPAPQPEPRPISRAPTRPINPEPAASQAAHQRPSARHPSLVNKKQPQSVPAAASPRSAQAPLPKAQESLKPAAAKPGIFKRVLAKAVKIVRWIFTLMTAPFVRLGKIFGSLYKGKQQRNNDKSPLLKPRRL